MIDNASVTGRYDENVNIWENDIQGLCSMIQRLYYPAGPTMR